MSNATSVEIANSARGFKARHLELYFRSAGAEGHTMDMRHVGGHQFTTHCLIRYVGRKSGKTIITPLIYGDIGGEVVICASKGGADYHPAWYLNIVASKEIYFQIATQAYRATWREPVGAERKTVWEFMQGIFPPYTAYQASTKRELPLVMMSPLEPVEIFKG